MAQQAGTRTGRGEFARTTEPFRRELLAHCYRMLGSIDDAEDLVQETYLRAWRSYERVRGPVLGAHVAVPDRQQRLPDRPAAARPAAAALRPRRPGARTRAPPPAAGTDVAWLQPIPDALVTPESADPAAIAASRESLRLALIASFQYLPPRQRAVLILREVLAFPAADVAADARHQHRRGQERAAARPRPAGRGGPGS